MTDRQKVGNLNGGEGKATTSECHKCKKRRERRDECGTSGNGRTCSNVITNE